MAGVQYIFSNCGASGVSGPSQGQVNAAYLGTNLKDKVTSRNGIQEWVAPSTGYYDIEVSGAQGGGNPNYLGGKGAKMKGTFYVTVGTVLRILVGQAGATRSSGTNCDGGGGGGSYVVTSNGTPLIVAGGGGGAGNAAGKPGTITNNGTGGGSAGHGSSGAGLIGNGAKAGWGSNSSIAQSFTNGGAGGTVIGATDSIGGFGGGSAGHGNCSIGGGAGGGYSGGHAVATYSPGNGGGSFNSGESQDNIQGFNSGHGRVLILVNSRTEKVLVKDGDDIKSWSGTSWNVVCKEEDLTKTHFITSGMEEEILTKQAIDLLVSEFPEVYAYYFDTSGVRDKANFVPANLVKNSNVITSAYIPFEKQGYYFFGEGAKPMDGNHLTYTLDSPKDIDRFSVSARHHTYDSKVRGLRFVFKVLNPDLSESIVTHSVELPDDSSWTDTKTLLYSFPEVIKSVSSVEVYVDSLWATAIQGLSGIQFTMLQFYEPDRIEYTLTTTSTTGLKSEPWVKTGEHETVLQVPELDITWKSGSQNAWKGTLPSYYVANGLKLRIRGIAYSPTGKEIARSNIVYGIPYKWVSHGLPIIKPETLISKLAVTHDEQVAFDFTVTHQQSQKDLSYSVVVKNLTKVEEVHRELSGKYAEKVFGVDIPEKDSLIDGDNILRVYLEDSRGVTSYEDVLVRRYSLDGYSVTYLGERYATKGIDFNVSKPDGTDIRVLFSTDKVKWERYNLITELWEDADPMYAYRDGMYVDEAKALTEKEFYHFEGHKLYLMAYMVTDDPWKEPKLTDIRLTYDSVAQVRYFFNVDGQENAWYMFDKVTKKWILVQRPIDQAVREFKGNTTAEVMGINPDQWATFPLGGSVTVGMVLYTNDKTRTPVIRSVELSDITRARTSMEAGELRLFDGYYYSPTLDMEYICQWESISYDIIADASKHLYRLDIRTFTGTMWTEWTEVTPTTSSDLANILPEGYKLQFRVYFKSLDKLTSPKLLPTVNIAYRISSKEVLDANMQKIVEDLKQTKISLANLEFKHHSTDMASRYNLNNIVIENFNDTSEVFAELNVVHIDGTYTVGAEGYDGEVRLTAIDLPWFSEYVMLHAQYEGDVTFEVSFDGVEYAPISVHEKRNLPDGASQVLVKAKFAGLSVVPSTLYGIAVIY